MSNPPTPTAIKLAYGNPGKRPMNPDEPMPPVGAQMPEGMSEAAQKEWGRISKQLENAGILTEIDADALGLYCEAYARYKHANAQLARFGIVVRGARTGFPVQSPFLAIANKAFEQMRSILTEFGMTPSSRTRVSKVQGGKKKSRLLEAIGGGGSRAA